MIKNFIEYQKYQVFLWTFSGLQILACAASFYFLGHSSVIRESWLANVPDGIVGMFWLQFMWVWYMANGLIGVSAYWEGEVNDRFPLEVWRHASFKQWLWRKMQFIWVFNTILYGLVPLPFLLAFYPRELLSVFSLIAFLILYSTHLSLVLLILTFFGMETIHAFAVTLTFHAVNVLFNGADWPNTLQYFLIGERAGPLSFVVVTGLLLLTMGIMLEKTTTMIFIKRKD
ncbi:MAG: hypothetical protein DDT30_01211 [Dehalococcoidia bacterium]|nr:hypothetical protein [Bacillota bacterium]MBT9142349.1 hypothetical protein [Bacillota bacterium]